MVFLVWCLIPFWKNALDDQKTVQTDTYRYPFSKHQRDTLKITRVIAIYMNPTSLRQELLWVDIFIFLSGTAKPSTEHQLGARGALILHRFSSPFFLICKLLVSFTGRLTPCFSLALASVLLILSILHPRAPHLQVLSVCSSQVLSR